MINTIAYVFYTFLMITVLPQENTDNIELPIFLLIFGVCLLLPFRKYIDKTQFSLCTINILCNCLYLYIFPYKITYAIIAICSLCMAGMLSLIKMYSRHKVYVWLRQIRTFMVWTIRVDLLMGTLLTIITYIFISVGVKTEHIPKELIFLCWLAGYISYICIMYFVLSSVIKYKRKLNKEKRV